MGFLSDPIFRHGPGAAHFSDGALLERFIRVEAALAGAQTALGVIPEGVAPAIRDAEISFEGIAEGVAKAGVPVP
ncbi:MAG: 3-carboxy-cis,cis-muconate cycloisomerase, partial [Pseudomonadota bacterium]